MKDSSTGFRYVKPVGLVLALAVLLALFGLGHEVHAKDELNPSEVTLYFLYDKHREIIGDIPDGYNTSYKINVDGLSGTPKYEILSAYNIVVSEDGIITPDYATASQYNPSTQQVDTWKEYYPGVTKVRVTCGDYSQDIKVTVKDYAEEYASNAIDNVLSEIITDGMSDLDKLTAITKWIATNTDYGSYSSYVELMVYGNGTCWASSSAILEMCRRAGVNAGSRVGYNDSGAGSAHVNTIALCDGKYYVADAGFTGTKPRYYYVREEPLGFLISKASVITQYDGFDTDVVIPSEISGHTITTLGIDGIPAFSSAVKSLYLPDTIQSIGSGSLSGQYLQIITVDPNNQYFTVCDGVLYSKDKTKLYLAPSIIKSLTIDNNTTEIMQNGLSYLEIDKLVFPNGVKILNNGSLQGSKINELVLNEGIETIGDKVFYEAVIPRIVLPSTVKTLGKSVFARCKTDEVVLSSGIEEIPEGAFSSSTITSVVIPEGVSRIGNEAFYNCSSLKSVSIPSSVTEIGSKAFDGISKINIYYAGTQEEWNRISFDTAIPEGATVYFESVRVTGIDIGDGNITLDRPGESVSLGANVVPANASNKEITYTSDNPSVARVIGDKITPVSEGECKVTATTEDGGYQAVYNIRVKYTRYKLTIDGGEVYSISELRGQTEIEFVEGTILGIRPTKTSSDCLLFSKWVCDDGITLWNCDLTDNYLTIVLPGKNVTVKAEYLPILVSSINLYAPKTYICTDEEIDISASVYPNNAYDKNVTWASSDNSILTVDDQGHVVGIAPGQVAVTATAVDGSGVYGRWLITVRDHNWKETGHIEPTEDFEGDIEYTCQYCGRIKHEPANTGEYTRYKLTIEGGEIYELGTNNVKTEMVFIKGQHVLIRTTKNSLDGVTFVKWLIDDDIEIVNNKTVKDSNIHIILPARDVTIKAIYEPIPMDSIYINYSKLVMCEGEEMELKASIYPSTAYDKSIVWSSSNESAITIDQEGHVTAVGQGKSNIVAASVDGSVSSSKITIKVGDHYWEETKRTSATYDKEGKITYKCSNCGKKKTEIIPKLNPGKFSEDKGHWFSWKKVNGKWYYKTNFGTKAVGLWKISGNVYYFSSKGVMQTGWQTIGGNKYYFTSKGIMKTGWQTISKKRYYFSKKGVMATGFKTISSKIYYFSKEGVFKTGWKKVSGKYYYFTSKGAKTGWQTISKKKYHFDSKGVMATGSVKVSGKYYLFGTDGVLVKSGWRKDASGKRYYVKKTGEVTTGWKTISGEKYYFSKKGVMSTGLKTIGDDLYYFDESGHMVTGKVTIDGQEYEFASTGEAVVIPETAPED